MSPQAASPDARGLDEIEVILISDTSLLFEKPVFLMLHLLNSPGSIVMALQGWLIWVMHRSDGFVGL